MKLDSYMFASHTLPPLAGGDSEAPSKVTTGSGPIGRSLAEAVSKGVPC